MAKGDKVNAIMFLIDMKEYSKKRQRQVAEQFQNGKATSHEVKKVAKANKAITQLLQLMQDCPMELDELHEMLSGIKADNRQYRLTPKNPL